MIASTSVPSHRFSRLLRLCLLCALLMTAAPEARAGELIFIAATKDAHLRAFDERTGQELWKAKLPAAGYATPCTYEVDGRQYVVIAAGGGKIGTPASDAYVAFSLPGKL